MKTSVKEIENLTAYGRSLVGKSAQSRILTGIGNRGQLIWLPEQLITAFEIVWNLGEPQLMVTLGGESVYEDSLFNVK